MQNKAWSRPSHAPPHPRRPEEDPGGASSLPRSPRPRTGPACITFTACSRRPCWTRDFQPRGVAGRRRRPEHVFNAPRRPAGRHAAGRARPGNVVGGGASRIAVVARSSAPRRRSSGCSISASACSSASVTLQFAPCPVAVAEAFEGPTERRLPRASPRRLRRGDRGPGPRWRPWSLAQLARSLRRRRRVDRALPRAGRGVFRHADRWRREADKATSLTASRRLKHLCATAFCYAFGWEVPFVHLVSYAEDAGHAPSRAAGVVVAVGVGGSAGRILSARCADAVGAPRVFSALILATCAADLVLPWAIRHAGALYVYGAVVGTTAGGLIALTTPMARTCLADTAGLPRLGRCTVDGAGGGRGTGARRLFAIAWPRGLRGAAVVGRRIRALFDVAAAPAGPRHLRGVTARRSSARPVPAPRFIDPTPPTPHKHRHDQRLALCTTSPAPL